MAGPASLRLHRVSEQESVQPRLHGARLQGFASLACSQPSLCLPHPCLPCRRWHNTPFSKQLFLVFAVLLAGAGDLPAPWQVPYLPLHKGMRVHREGLLPSVTWLGRDRTGIRCRHFGPGLPHPALPHVLCHPVPPGVPLWVAPLSVLPPSLAAASIPGPDSEQLCSVCLSDSSSHQMQVPA